MTSINTAWPYLKPTYTLSTARLEVWYTPSCQKVSVCIAASADPYKTCCRLSPPAAQTTTNWLPVPLRTRHWGLFSPWRCTCPMIQSRKRNGNVFHRLVWQHLCTWMYVSFQATGKTRALMSALWRQCGMLLLAGQKTKYPASICQEKTSPVWTNLGPPSPAMERSVCDGLPSCKGDEMKQNWNGRPWMVTEYPRETMVSSPWTHNG